MQTARLLTIMLLYFFVSLLVLGKDCSANNESIGSITNAVGAVTIKRPGETERSVVVGDKIFVGEEIRSGKESYVQVTFTDESFVNISPNSALRANQYFFDRAQDRKSARFKLVQGTARFVLFKVQTSDSAFYVETRDAVVELGPIGDFAVKIVNAGTEVAVFNQSARVRNSSNFVIGQIILGMNQKCLVRPNMPPAPPCTLTDEERNSYIKAIRPKH